MAQSIGLDFGTTNSVLAFAGATESESTVSLRTVLVFRPEAGQAPRVSAGDPAIRQFIDSPESVRFIQSFKSFAASPQFTGTGIFGKRYQFEDLLAAYIAKLWEHGAPDGTPLPDRLVVGRPVRFAGATPNEALALERYEAAFARLGVQETLFVYEPVAAAFYYAQTLARSANVLVADFGGGTTDYSIMRFERAEGRLAAVPLAAGGVGVAGDQFDYRILLKLVLPVLGRGTQYQSMGKRLAIPNGYFASFARWNELSLFKSSSQFAELQKLRRYVLEPDKIDRLIEIVEEDHGYALYQAVTELKRQLSGADTARLDFPVLPELADVSVTRADFESWISDDLLRMRLALDETLVRSGLADRDIDMVFLTGGTSFVPAVRDIFLERFGPERVSGGSELVSIASGLALIGARDDAPAWASARP